MKSLHYSFVGVMIIVALSATYFIINPAQTQKPKPVSGVTRNAVTKDKLQQLQPQIQYVVETEDKGVDWSAISAGIIAIIGAGGAVISRMNSSKNEKFQESVNDKFKGIYTLLDEFKDTQYRRNIDIELSKIGFEAIGYVKDNDLKVLMEGMTDRTRNFARDTVQHRFDEEAYQNAISKMGARTVECRTQVRNLNFNAQFEKEIDAIRCKNLNLLKADLKALAEDKQYNDKYTRQQDIICRFLKSLLRDTIYAHVENLKHNA